MLVYILESSIDESYYIGVTENLKKRLSYHNVGKSNYTSKKRPWRVKYTEEYKTKTEALQRERQLKSWKSRSAINKLINNGPVV
ncbi:MAG TPA: GIY-YIG nuclease family protein [Candidatus Woesebacteria bacterium]|nr:GIY-YIG nuclease family protein [Candidatus Woesebacteria bacterium]